MNDPISNPIRKRAHFDRTIALFVLSILWLVVSGCGREEAPPTAAPVAPTPTSSAILAATATTVVGENTEVATATNAGPSVVQEATSEDATSEDDAPNDDSSSDDSSTDDAPSDDASSDDTTSEAESSEAEPVCEKEIALDLVGHPQYAELIDQLGCPLDAASLDPVAINEFGPGPEFDRFMLWFSTDAQIYVLKPDRSWASFADTWTEDDAEILCNPTDDPMTSPPLPRRGFGKLWCADEAIQETMGTIIREERLCQHTVLQDFEQGQLLGCFEDATIRYLQLFTDGTWDMKFVQ